MNSLAVPVRTSLRNILLPTDFSSCSETALAYGVGLCRRCDTTLYTVTVVREEITDYVQPPDPFYLRHSAEKKMASLGGSVFVLSIGSGDTVARGTWAVTAP